MPRDHAIRHVVARVLNEPWFITETKLEQICAVLELRASGVQLTREEIAAKVGDKADKTSHGLNVTTTPAGVRVIPLMGVISQRMNMFNDISGGTSNEQLAAAVNEAVADPKVKAIVLRVDSPGGTVLGTAEVADAVLKARAVKPIVAVADGQMCSAAYFIASAASEIIASPSSDLGSIGCLLVHRESAKANETAGVKYTIIKAGAHKADMNPYEPLSEQGLATGREMVRTHYNIFVEAVARHRGLTFSEIEDRYGQGKTFVGAQAVARGLADRVGTLADVVAGVEKKLSGGRGVSANANQGIVFEELTVNELIIKALVGKGLLQDGASDEVAKAVLQGWYHAQGKTPPTDELQILKDLMAPAAAAPTPPAAPAPSQQPPSQTPQQAAEGERLRIKDIQASAKCLDISDQEFVQGLVDSGVSAADAKAQMVDRLAKANGAIPRKDLDKAMFSDDHAKFLEAATAAMLASLQQVKVKEKPNLSGDAVAFSRGSAMQIAHASLRLAGFRVDHMDDVDVCKLALGWGNPDVMRVVGYSGGGSWNTPAAFPNVLSNLQNKFLDGAAELAEYTWRDWVYIRPSVKDFKTATLVRMGVLPELSGRNQDGKFPRATTTEEVSWFAAQEFGQEWDLTPIMMANDDLGAFSDATVSQIDAAEATRNRLCIERLTSNPTLADGTALFHASRSNLIAAGSGGVPSRTQAALVRQTLRNQLSPGAADARRRMNLTLTRVLVPVELEDEAEQTFAVGLMPEVVPATDANRNFFRGRVAISVDAMLDDASTQKWYGFSAKGKRQTVILAFQQGYERDRIESWYEPSTGCRVFKIQSNFAAAIGDHRGAVENAGQ